MENIKYICSVDEGNGYSYGAMCIFDRMDNRCIKMHKVKNKLYFKLLMLYYYLKFYPNIRIYKEK